MTTTITSMTATMTAALQFSGGSGTAGTASASSLATSASALLAQNPGAKLLDAQISRDGAKLSSIGKVALALDDFRSLATSLSTGGLNLAASASGTAVAAQLSGTSGTAAAVAGTHTVDVKQLAQAQQLATKALASSSAAIGSGASTVIKIDTGAAGGTTLRIDSPNNTLDGIAKAMQDAGIDAKVTPSGKGFALTMTGQTGAANAMRVTVSGDAALKGLLTYQPGNTAGMTQTAAAQDAQATVDGKTVTSATNKLAGAIPGVALTLAATGKSDVKVSNDASSVAANVKNFVTAFNTLNTQLTTLKNANSDSAAAVNPVLNQLGSALAGADKATLEKMGVTRKNGALVLDETKLNAAIAADADGVAKAFSNGGTGLADRLGTQVAQQMATGGLLAKQSATVQADMDKLNTQKTKVTDAVNRQAAALAQQYALGGTGGSTMFGMLGGGTSMSLFDFLA